MPTATRRPRLTFCWSVANTLVPTNVVKATTGTPKRTFERARRLEFR
jgi:hypothetical protein